MKKFKLLVFTVLCFLFMTAANNILAVDLTITCTNSTCDMLPSAGEALFYENNILPGFSVTQQLTVVNDGDGNCELVMDAKNENDPDGLAGKLDVDINDISGWRTSDGKTLRDFFDTGDVVMGTIAGSSSQIYEWMVSMDTSVGNEYQDKQTVFDFDLIFNCQGFDPPELVIDKTNDKKGMILGVGDVITYTITVNNTGSGSALAVVVEDVQPVSDYFDYRENSGHLVCTNGTDIALTATGSNPYFWALGDMEPDEECVLIYELEIINDSIAGTHYNIAVAYGEGKDGNTYFSDPVLDPFNVGYKKDLSAGITSQVLGAATSVGQVLGAATGSPSFWLILAITMILFGILIRFFINKKRRSVGHTLILFILFSILSPVSILAADTTKPVVAIVQLPEYINSRDFEISYTALDAGGSGLKDVKVEYQKEGDGWQDIGTYTDSARKIDINNSKVNEDKKYYFKATACDNAANCVSSETFTNVDTKGPPKPENFSKEKTGAQSYKIKWHNPDNNDVYQVYIYRSDKKDFNADNGTEVARVNVSKNTDSEWNDAVVPDGSKEYYYVIRSVDRAGNGSDLVGDLNVVYEEGSVEGEITTGQEELAGQEAVSQSGTGFATGGNIGQILGEEAKEASDEATMSAKTEGESMDKEDEEKEISSSKTQWFLIIGGGVLLAVAAWWFFSKKEE